MFKMTFLKRLFLEQAVLLRREACIPDEVMQRGVETKGLRLLGRTGAPTPSGWRRRADDVVLSVTGHAPPSGLCVRPRKMFNDRATSRRGRDHGLAAGASGADFG